MKKVIAAFALLALCACTDEEGATKALKSAGLKPVKVGGYAAWSCDGRSDTYATKFEAINPNGEKVTGAVCSGWLKGKTIRYD